VALQQRGRGISINLLREEKHIVAALNLGTISEFLLDRGKLIKTCVEMAGRRTFLMNNYY
jgi:hypothetical protein